MADPAVRIRRNSDFKETNDDFPTPPWATRVLFEYIAPSLLLNAHKITVLEPACGRGHMVSALRKLKFKVSGSDNIDYGAGFPVVDYLTAPKFAPHDWVITNPPYKHANLFALRALKEAKCGVALLMRTIWVEGVGRHDNLFKPFPPTAVYVFSRRMNAAQGRLVQGGGAAMSHSWFFWDKRIKTGYTKFGWIPPDAQCMLERKEDYK